MQCCYSQVDDSLFQIAQYYDQLSEGTYDWDSCLYYSKKAASFYLESNSLQDYFEMKNGISGIYLHELQFVRANEYLQTIIHEIQNVEFEGKESTLALTIGNYAYSFYELQKYEEAEKLYKESIDMFIRMEDFEQISWVTHNLSIMYKRQDKLLKAIEAYDNAYSLLKTKDNLSIVENYYYHTALGNLLIRINDFERGKYSLAQGLIYANKINDPLKIQLSAMLNAICAYFDLRASDCAEYCNMIEISENSKVKNFYIQMCNQFALDEQNDNQNREENLMQLINYLSTEEIVEKELFGGVILKIVEKELMKKSNLNFINSFIDKLILEISAVNNYSRILIDSKKFQLDYYLSFHPKELSEIEAISADFFDLVKESRKRNDDKSSKIYYSSLDAGIFRSLLKNNIYIENPTNLFSLFESNKSLSIIDEISINSVLKNSGIPDSLLLKESEMQSLIAYYKRVIQDNDEKSDPIPTQEYLHWKKELIRVQTEYDALLRSFEEDFPMYYQLKYSDFDLDLDVFQKSLKKDELVFEYYVSDSNIYQLLINSDTSFIYQLNNKEEIESKIEEYLLSIRKKETNQNLAKELYLNLIPTYDINLSAYRNLIFIPDGFLLQLPFETLTNSEGNLLIANHNIEYQYSASLMFMLNDKRKSITKNLAAYAFTNSNSNISLNRACNQTYSSDLLCSEKEVSKISKMAGKGADEYYRTKTEFENFAPNNNIIHISTHACTDHSDHTLSRIYFEDDFITNYEISALNLNADLAVLSACETGSGYITKGEGVMSLAKSFFYAG